MPFVEGRTHRASEPIDPNSRAAGEQSDAPRPLLGEDFETSHTIFQPEVNGEDTGAQSEVTEGGGEEERQRSLSRSRSQTRGYAAQYPYQTIRDRQAPSGSQASSVQSGSYTSSGGGYNPSGSEILTRRRVQTYGSSAGTGTDYQRNTQRRVVAYSGGRGVGSENPGYQTQSQTRLVAYGSGGSNTGTEGSNYQTQSGTRMVSYGSSGSDGREGDSQSRRRFVTHGSGSSNTQRSYPQSQSQRVVAYGGGGGGSGDTNTYPQPVGSGSGTYGTGNRNYYGTSTGYQPSSSVSRSGHTSSQPQGTATGVGRQYGSSSQSQGIATGVGRQYGSSSQPQGTATGVGRQYGGSSIRYENGRYYDSAGHEVDPHGRHRDDSGRLVSSSSNTDDVTQQGLPIAYDPIISQISNDPVGSYKVDKTKRNLVVK